MPFRTLCLILSLIVLLFTGRTAFADLKPEEIALVAASGSRESQALARYYCKVRGVPVENICSVDLPLQEVLPREDWQASVRPAIREWLAANDPQQRLRCLVTLWDVPLKITAGNAPDDLVAYRKYLDAERDARLAGLAVIARELQRLADGEFDDGVGSGNAAPGEAGSQLTLERLKSDLESQLQAAQRAIGQRADGEKKTRDLQRLQQLATTAGGSRVLLEGINNEITRQGAAAPAELRAGFEQLRGRLLGYHEARALLEQQPASPDRDTVALALVERSTGILGSVEWLDAQLAVAKKQETGASFDSELSLVLWPSDYRLLRW